MNRTLRKLVCTALAAVMVFGLCACGAAGTAAVPAANGGTEGTITVSASASVSLVPDKASITFGVTTQEETAALAQSRNGEDVARVIAALTAAGVDEKSIRTEYYSLYPQYDYSFTESGEPRVTGYMATTTLSVRDRDIAELGDLLSVCVDAGINRIESVSFLCSGYDEAYREALKQAVDASREKAEALAEAAGRSLGGVVSVTEGWQDTSARYGRAVNASYDTVAEAAMEAGGPTLQPGETEISATVTVSYAIG